jgi:hypothetical protein
MKFLVLNIIGSAILIAGAPLQQTFQTLSQPVYEAPVPVSVSGTCQCECECEVKSDFKCMKPCDCSEVKAFLPTTALYPYVFAPPPAPVPVPVQTVPLLPPVATYEPYQPYQPTRLQRGRYRYPVRYPKKKNNGLNLAQLLLIGLAGRTPNVPDVPVIPEEENPYPV